MIRIENRIEDKPMKIIKNLFWAMAIAGGLFAAVNLGGRNCSS